VKRLVLGGTLLAACGSPAIAPDPMTFEFGPYALTAGQELNNQCVSVTLNNDEPLYINSVELTTGTGFHHSNWFWVPESDFGGGDGTWKCSDRQYDEAVAGLAGAVLFAQSTQATHELQQFPEGAAIVIPPRSRIVAGTHLLNTGEDALQVSMTLKITPIAEATRPLNGMSFTNQSIRIPPHRVSRMSMECPVETAYRNVYGAAPDFQIVYALAHYHDLGTGMTIEAVKPDGSATTVFTTANRIGDALGGMIDPGFDITGYTKMRYWCEFDNPRDTDVTWGVGTREMCTFLAFTDSPAKIAGGALNYNETPVITDHGAYIDYAYPCDLIATPIDD
jgi:uncharacterized membrane protein